MNQIQPVESDQNSRIQFMTGPIDSYRAMIASETLTRDPVQALAAEKLQLLHNRLTGYVPGKEKGGLKGLLQIGRPDPAPVGLYIYGGVGRGKSMLMDMFFETAPTEPRRRVHFHEFMQEVHGAVHEWRQAHKEGTVKGDDPIAPVAADIAKSATLLCFDEFQVTDITDAMILGRLFTALFEHGVVVVATSNRPPDDLYKDGLNRALFEPFIDLMKQKLDILELDGGVDYRMQRMKGAPVYYSPLSEETEEAMQTAWERLTDMEKGETVILELKGRHVIVPQSAKGVARFTFDDLCRMPLGAADYLKVAITYHTVLIDNIPELEANMRNEAKRFVTLIDALYEKKVKLIASAETEPEGIYPDGDGSFEFERTASRLEEMRSEEYLSLSHGG